MIFLAFLGPNELSVIKRCPYYRGARTESLTVTIILAGHCLLAGRYFEPRSTTSKLG